VPPAQSTTLAALPTLMLIALSRLAVPASLAPAAAATVQLAPGQSITRAMQAAAPGDVIVPADGVYERYWRR
jgi:hypothetical protein